MEILTLIFGILALSFCIAYIASIQKIKKMVKTFQEVIDSRIQLQKAYENYVNVQNATKNIDIHTENFIKFLSDSRDWAFEYIENVQNGIEKFMTEVAPQINFYDKQSKTENEEVSISNFTLKKISKEIEELKKFLPEKTLDKK
jgi:CHASE3 domain sensor protein